MTSIEFTPPSTSCSWLLAPCRCHEYSGDAKRIVAGRGLRPGVRSWDGATNIRLRWSRVDVNARGGTNIRLRWSREVMEWPACYKHPAPLEPDGDGMAGCYKHSAPLEPGGDGMAGATNIRLRWSREAMEWPACYKHSAPLEPGGDGIAGLQTFGSAGAGRRWNGLRATNIRLRWSRVDVNARGGTNIRLRWSREVMEWPACYKHPAPLEPDGDGMAGCYKHSAPLEPGGDGMAGATNIRLRWSRAEMQCSGWYKHSAPLEPGGDGMASVLQTFGSAGAGWRWNGWALQTIGSA